MHVNKFLIITMFLTGCASTDPVVTVVTQEVKVPIAVPCKEELPIKPDYCFPKLLETADILEKTKCLLSDRLKSIGYEIELVAKLKACK